MSTPSSLVYLDKPIDHWVRQLADCDPLVRRLAAHALSMIGPQGHAKSVPALTVALDDSESFVKVWAAAALARIEPSNRRAPEVLLAGLRDRHSFVRSLAAWHLGRQGPHMSNTNEALAVLHELLQDDDFSVRAEAELAIKSLQVEGVGARE